MATSNTLRRLKALERLRARHGTTDMLVLFEPLSGEDHAKAQDHKRRGAQVLVVQFVEPSLLHS